MSVPVYRRVTGSANQINDTSVYRHTVCNCERASVSHTFSMGSRPQAAMSSSPFLSASPTLSPSAEVDHFFDDMLAAALEGFLIHSAKNHIISSAIFVSRALDAEAVNSEAPTDVFVLMFCVQGRHDGRVRGGIEGLAHGGGDAGGCGSKAPTRRARRVTCWCKDLPVRMGRRGLQPLQIAHVLTILKESVNGGLAGTASPPPSQPPCFFPACSRQGAE